MPEHRTSWIPAAQLLRPQGRRGELLAEPHVEIASLSPGRRFVLASSAASIPPPEEEGTCERTLESAWQPVGKNAGRVVLKLAGVDDISGAELLAGQFLLLDAAHLPALEPDTFRVRDLVGCALFDGERLAGTVVDVQFPIAADGRTRLADAPDLLAVQASSAATSDSAATSEIAEQDRGPEQDRDPAHDGNADPPEPVLVPFVRAWLTEVDLPRRRIVMHLPPGLFELDDALPADGSTPQ